MENALPIVGIVRTEWSGTSGGPGLTQMAVLGAAGGDWNPNGAQAAVNAVRAFWAGITAHLPDELRLLVSPVVDTYDRATGDLFSSHTAATAPATVAGTSTAGYAGGAGVKVTWNTNQIRDGRRVRGSTFIVPIAGSVWTANGNIGTVAATAINNAATQLINDLNTGSTPLGIWSRPREATETREARAGFATEVVSGNVGNKSAILRGRRD